MWREFVPDLITARPRSLASDSQRIMAANPYPRNILWVENVPLQGPFVLIVNHYNRPGLRPYHCGMAITSAVADRRPGTEIHWSIISEWHSRRLGPIPLPTLLFRWTFRRITHIYGLVSMPQQTGPTMNRATALRHALELAATEPLGLMPEGGGTGALRQPLPGSGLFIEALARRGLPIIPVGVWEEGHALFVRFGQPFAPELPPKAPRHERDSLARQAMMVAIGRLLPEPFWGEYNETIRQSPSR
jgi:hypothetical protein